MSTHAREVSHTLHPLVYTLLKNRGITEEDAIADFLTPDYNEHVHDPFLLNDMVHAVDRILKAIKENEKIIIYTDYDTDGIPSGVIWHDFFTKIGFTNFENYIPHRHKEGYGLNAPAVETFAKEGASVVITADCGITDSAEVELGQSLGMDMIVTDHHIPEDELPPAYAVINPKRTDNTYPFPHLCGCGVAFKLICALLTKGNHQGLFSVDDGWEKWLLDMVGLATIADMVPLIGENRVFAYYGLKVLQRSPRPGLVNLLRKVRVPQTHLKEDDVGFVIGPRINAASRMDIPYRAFSLLTTQNEQEANELVSHLDSLNTKRKGIVASIIKEARQKIEEREARELIVLGNPKWQPGLLGLAANTLAEEYGKSVFLWGRGEDGETIKGSCRSDGSISIVECMRHAQGAFLDYGGHHASGGFSVDDEKIHTLEDSLIEAFGELPQEDEEVSSELCVDGELALSEVNWETQRQIQKLAPFGMGNPRPVFLLRDAVIDEMRWFGKHGEHIELQLRDDTGAKVKAITFFVRGNAQYEALAQKGTVTCKVSLEDNFFMGKRELRVRILECV